MPSGRGRSPLYVSNARRKRLAACWTRRLHVSVSRNSRFAFRKPLHVSAGESACASSPNSYAPQLLDREALHSLSVNGACSSRSQLAVNLLSKNHLTSRTDRPAPCRTSEADSSPCDVRSVGEFSCALRSCQAKFRRNRKNNSETQSDSAGHFPYPGKRRAERNSDIFTGVADHIEPNVMP